MASRPEPRDRQRIRAVAAHRKVATLIPARRLRTMSGSIPSSSQIDSKANNPCFPKLARKEPDPDLSKYCPFLSAARAEVAQIRADCVLEHGKQQAVLAVEELSPPDMREIL